MSRKMLQVRCAHCNKEFDKQERYVKISEKKGRLNFCSISHAASYKLLNGKSDFRPRPENLIPGNGQSRRDQFSDFKYYMRKAVNRKKKGNLSLADIKECWDRQAGKCALSGLPMKLNGYHKDMFELASLDRIDSHKLYEKDNIQFVVLPLNLAKHSADNEDFIKFLMKLRLNP